MNENDTTPEQQVGPDPEEPSSERPAPPPRRRLHRSRSDRVLAGVCGGIADYAGVNPVLVRIAFIALSFLGAGGVLLYVIAALFLPVEDETTSEAERILRRSGRASPWAWVGIVVLALFALPALGFLFGAPFVWDNLGPLETLSFAIVLVGLGVLLLRGDGHRGGDAIEYGPAAPPQANAPQAGAQPWTPPPSFAPQGPPPSQPTAPIYPPVVQGPPPAERRKSPLVWYTLAIALIVLGLVAVADNLLDQSLDFDQYAALVLIVVGAGLVVGAWWGRARSLMVVGLLLIPFVLTGSLIDRVPLNGDAGSRFYDPVNVSDVKDRYELGMGELTIDLSRLDIDDEQLDVHASLGMGKLEVLVPRDIDLDVEGFAGAGSVQIAGSSRDGLDVLDERVLDGPGEALLRLDARVGLGEVRVIRTGSQSEPGTSRERNGVDRPRERDRQQDRRDEGSNP